MRRNYKASRYGVSKPLGFRTLHEIRKAEQREKEARVRRGEEDIAMTAEGLIELVKEARKNKPK